MIISLYQAVINSPLLDQDTSIDSLLFIDDSYSRTYILSSSIFNIFTFLLLEVHQAAIYSPVFDQATPSITASCSIVYYLSSFIFRILTFLLFSEHQTAIYFPLLDQDTPSKL